MGMVEKTGSFSDVARVRAVELEGTRLILEFRNGRFFPIYGKDPWGIEEGSVVLFWQDGDTYHVELAAEELWPEELWVGIIRLKLPDKTILDTRNQWRVVPTNSEIPYSEGYTVEAQDSCGVVRVLSEQPLKYLDLPTIDDKTIAKFKREKGTGHETFDDFGGLQHVVNRARKLIEVPIVHREAVRKIGARPIKGVLFTGPPGTGKTMLARIIANITESVFYEISGPEVFSKWYGESEELIRRLFEDAANQDQSIIFFDEIDSVAGRRADESHEASRRVVAQLLALMDGFKAQNNVVVIAATNRPQDIDQALMRPGRFDSEINFPMPDQNDREAILKASAKGISTEEDLPHRWIAQRTKFWTAAELVAIWTEASLFAAEEDRSVILAEDYIGGFEAIASRKRYSREFPPKGTTT